MLLFTNGRTNFLNPFSLNNTFKNRKRYIRKREIEKKCFSPKFIDEKISNTEHSNILNEYQDELKFLMLNKKCEESIDNSQTLKDASTRDSDIIICVESNCPETTEKIDDSENSEEKKFKQEIYNDNSSSTNIINLINMHNSLINKNGGNYQKISKSIDVGTDDLKKTILNNSKHSIDKNSLDKIKKTVISNIDDNSMTKDLINKYHHYNLNHNNMEKLVEKINISLINNENNLKKNIQNDIFNINEEISNTNSNKNKKDSSANQNILIDKIHNNNYKSILSLSNDRDYMNSIKYISNKYSSSVDKMENNLIDALKENKKLIDDFKGKNKENSKDFDLSMLKGILKDKKIRKSVKLNFGFLKEISEKKFYSFLNENYLNNFHSLMDGKENNIYKNLENSSEYNFFLLSYFLLGINYIEKSKLNLNENELFSLVQSFMKNNESEKIKLGIIKKEKTKKIKFKGIKNEKKRNNIIRINLEEIFGKRE